MPPPPQFDAPHFLDFTSSVIEALNTKSINLAALKMDPVDITAPIPAPEETSEEILNNVIQKHVTGTEVAEGNLQGSSLGHVAESQSITALEAQLLEAVNAEISMHCPQNVLTDSYVSSELPSEPRCISIFSC